MLLGLDMQAYTAERSGKTYTVPAYWVMQRRAEISPRGAIVLAISWNDFA